MSEDSASNSNPECEGCSLDTTRRSFVQNMLVLAAGAVAAAGLTPDRALALPVAFSRATRRTSDEHSYPIPAQDGATIDRDNQAILVRYQSHIFAFALSCPHQNTALRWMDKEGRFQCPKHHSKYQPDGTFISGRATRGMDRYAVRLAGDSVVVNFDHLFKEDEDHAGWLAQQIVLGQ
jgi:nitrite reductase/ring-hydroxylating ferredoxin subunit